jgi:hemerythrin-like domain-containing protein
MIEFSNRICRTLHEEHLANIALLSRVARLTAAHRQDPPSVAEPAVRQLLSELATELAAEVARHFDFEEQGLFVYLDGVGETAIGAYLTEEHAVLRPLLSELAGAAHQALAGGFDPVTWVQFRRLAREASERLPAHIQKEEMALLPLVEDTMDAETEARLSQEYMEAVS